jgi:Rrf2 family protein
MIFANTTEYAIRGLSELAARNGTGPVLLDEIVAGTDLPRDFVAKIFQRLVHGGLLKSAKGRNGGFSLGRPAHLITLMEIIEIIEGIQPMDHCVVGMSA